MVRIADELAYIWASVPGLRVAVLKRSSAKHLKEMRRDLQAKLNHCIELYGEEFSKVDIVSPFASPKKSFHEPAPASVVKNVFVKVDEERSDDEEEVKELEGSRED